MKNNEKSKIEKKLDYQAMHNLFYYTRINLINQEIKELRKNTKMAYILAVFTATIVILHAVFSFWVS